MYIGDYWTIGNFDWMIADINYWINVGRPTACETPHVVIVPKSSLYTAKMNDTAVTTGGYLNSKMRTTNLNQAKTIIYTAFGENNILDHRGLFSNTVDSSGYVSAEAWVDSKVDLMDQIMVYGSSILRSAPTDNNSPHDFTSNNMQLSSFRLNPNLIGIGESYWLNNVISSMKFSYVANDSVSAADKAHITFGVRPVFGLTG